MTNLLGSAAALAAPSQATMDRCAQYAERAVQQYNQMMSSPQCKVEPALRWQPNYDNHYNGCLVLPEFAVRSEETIRLNHLKACGATGDGTPGGADAAAPTAPAAPSAPAAPGEPQPGGPAATPPVAAAAAQPGLASQGFPSPTGTCHLPPDLSQRVSTTTAGGVGLVTGFNGRTMTYHNWQFVQWANLTGTPAYQTQQEAMANNFSHVPVVTASVQRPAYFAGSCSGYPANTAGGPWIANGPAGIQYLEVNSTGVLTWHGLTAAGEGILLKGAAMTANAATTTPAQKPVATPPKPPVKH